MTDSIKNGLLRGRSYAILFKDDAALKDILDAINDLKTLATESEQLRKERDELAAFIRQKHDVLEVPTEIFNLCIQNR